MEAGATTPEKAPRRPRSDGIRSRQAILKRAASLATVEGIAGLTLSRLAEEVGMSKSGVYAHFGSKEELQLATVDFAEDVFTTEVIGPGGDIEPGVARLTAYADLFLRHVQESIYPGGCFFASALTELDTHPGPVRDRAFTFLDKWATLLQREVEAAQAAGEIREDVSAAQLTFELGAFLFMANTQFVARGDAALLDAARVAVRDRLAAAA